MGRTPAAIARSTVQGSYVDAPHSTGSAPPEFKLPHNATDCHHHIFDRAFPASDGSAPKIQATVEDYAQLKRRLGLTRSVVVAPFSYGTDNSCLLNALDKLGSKARGVAIITPLTTDAEISALHSRGVRGIRLYLGKGTPFTTRQFNAYANRIADRGWHIQIVAAKNQSLLGQFEDILAAAPCNLVIDHFGYVPQPAGTSHSESDAVRRLIDTGKVWVKLSGVYLTSSAGYPFYEDVDAFAKHLAQLAPSRVIWGTDWPHPGVDAVKPDGAKLVEQLQRWASDEALQNQILVDNPTKLYWYV